MSLASQTFNNTIFRTASMHEIDSHCEGIFLYRRDHLKKLKEVAKIYSQVPANLRHLEKMQNVELLLKEAESEGALKINLEKGTVSLIPWKKIVESFLAN